MSTDREALLELVVGAFRERDVRGAVSFAAAWFDLSPTDRVSAFDQAVTARRLEAAADPEGLSTTARAVLARLGRG